MTNRITDEQLDVLEASLEAAPDDVDECLLLENLRNDTPLLIAEVRRLRKEAIVSDALLRARDDDCRQLEQDYEVQRKQLERLTQPRDL